MKPAHRHEMKTNELAEWLSNLPQWAKKNLRVIIYVSVVIVLAGGSYFWNRYQKNVVSVKKQLHLTSLISQLAQGKTKILNDHIRGLDTSYMLMKVADSLQAAAQNANNNQMAAFALIKRAEALRAELHYRLEKANTQDITAQINRARESYVKAIEKAAAYPPLAAAAKFGLGLCEEELGNFETAQQIYYEITTDPNLEGTVAAVQTKQRLNEIADYRQEIVFSKPPVPQNIETILPQLTTTPVDSNPGPVDPVRNSTKRKISNGVDTNLNIVDANLPG